MSIFRSKMRV